MKLNKDAIGSSFDNFLEEENILVESDSIAIKRVIAFEVEKSMQEKHITKTEMAKRMGTSRSSLTRLLDPLNNSIGGSYLAPPSLFPNYIRMPHLFL